MTGWFSAAVIGALVHVPLRPIVSCVNTFAYDLSAYLANILSPLTGNSGFTVTNSAHFRIYH